MLNATIEKRQTKHVNWIVSLLRVDISNENPLFIDVILGIKQWYIYMCVCITKKGM